MVQPIVSIEGTNVIENGKSIPIIKYTQKVLKGTKVALKGSTSARSVALRLMSDFIATRAGLKEGRNTSNFSKPSARPDIQGSLTSFLKVFGVELQKTSLTGGAQAFLELKQSTSKDRSVSVTGRALQRGSSEELSFLEQFKLERGSKDDGSETFLGPFINQLKSSDLHNWLDSDSTLKESIIVQIEQKFENFALIDYLDKEHGGLPKVKVLANAAEVLNLRKSFKTSVLLTARQSRRAQGKVSIQIDAKLSDSAYNIFLDKAIDVTKKFHDALGVNFSSRFLTYAVQKFEKSSKISAEDFLKAIISIAKEFEKGSNTPLVYQTLIQKQKLGNSGITANINVPKGRQKKEASKTISDAQMTALVQRETERRMPKGPDKGPPLSPVVLTYRSGQFVESIKVIQNFRQQLITYYYAPNYRVHEKRGARAPRLLLQGSIRDTVKAVYGTRFRIVRGF